MPKFPLNVTIVPFVQHTPIQSRIISDLLMNQSIEWFNVPTTHLRYKVLNQGAMDLLTTHKLLDAGDERKITKVSR